MLDSRAIAPHDRYFEEVRRRADAAHAPGTAPAADGVAATWTEVPADEIGEALLQSWWVNGIDHVLFTSGADLAWFQEGIAKLDALGRPTPSIVTMLHENTSLNAACGYAMVAGRPIATAAHVELGTMNYGDAIHTAARGQYPVMITSGKTPTAYGGTAPGDRGQDPVWRQDLWDYGSIVRQYVKWDHELTALGNAGLTASRALQLVMTPPYGPAYMSIPRDVARYPISGLRFPSVARLGVARPPAGDPGSVAAAARLLVDAQNPLVTAGWSGRDPRTVPALAELSSLLALPYLDRNADRVNFPTDHPLHDAAPGVGEADVILVLESLTPWIPGYGDPHRDARVIHVGHDPVFARNPHYEFNADIRIAGDPYLVLTQLHDEAERLLTERRRAELAGRTERLARVAEQRRERAVASALASLARGELTQEYAAYAVAEVLEEDALTLSHAVSGGEGVRRHVPRVRPGSFFRCGSAGGGWGVGAAFGAKLAAPDEFVTLIVGDGFFLFGVPNAALWSAAHYKKPFLTVVLQNDEWTTGTVQVARAHPGGYAEQDGSYEGGRFGEPRLDHAKLAESAGAYGTNVSDPEALGPALERAVEVVRAGTPAVVAVQVAR
jgi:acetolactate synthase-1/2/3 large subunit